MVKKFVFFLLLLAAHPVLAQVNLNLGLRAYYPFTGNANDVSGNNNNPVFNNATLTADRFGNANSAYHFNGSSSYMQIPNSASLNMNTQISIAAWVKPTGFYTGPCGNSMLMAKGDGDFLPGTYSLRFADEINGCPNPTNTSTEHFYGPTPVALTPNVQLNQWYSVVCTNDGVTAKIYVNCVLRASGSIGSPSFTSAYDLYFGHMNNVQYPYWLNGDLDEIRIYNRALTVDEVNVLGGCPSLNPCQIWLATPAQPSYVDIGDLDISGNKVTIEATGNRTSFFSNGVFTNSDLVSKHTGSNDANYTLRPTYGFINTSNGFFSTPLACEISLNKTYHYAMVYDGATLKFYRDGFLLGQTAATGNLVLNNLNTTIGWIPSHNLPENFVGYMNEVRIWNVARTQTELRTYMNSSLPNPTTQTGLLAYYTFDDLQNKQGNSAWNGTLGGGASINATNPNCSFVADSCISGTPIGGIINDYTPVTAFDICNNKLTVQDATKFNTGDTVLLMQMKGAVIDSTNTATFGDVSNYNNAGNYEFNYVKSKTGNVVELKNKVTRQYDIPNGKVQLIRVPYYKTVAVMTALTCLAWDGSKGGVLALNVKDTINLQTNIDVSAKGFKGAIGFNPQNQSTVCSRINFYYPLNTVDANEKGESITIISNNRMAGRGKLAAGGGGGNGHNSGGGGGGNGAVGGLGGYQLQPCTGGQFDNRGIGGTALAYSTASNKIFMGSGGGAGHADNIGTLPPSGGNGAGIAIIIGDKMISNSNSIVANGDPGLPCIITGTNNCHDGMGGGGSGGTVLLSINQLLDNATIQNIGGKGADVVGDVPIGGRIGPGGGGGGGVAFLKSASVPANLTVTSTGGVGGVATQDANNPWGATAGSTGINLFNLTVPFSTTAFVKNIDSARIKDSATSCFGFDLKGFGYTNTYPIGAWQWYFGDGGTANTQNTTHIYPSPGSYNLKLVVTDINGCKDSIAKTISIVPFIADAGNDTAVCTAPSVTVVLHASAGTAWSWTPAVYLNNPNLQNPTATITNPTRFYVTVTNALGCTSVDSVMVSFSNSIVPAITISTASTTVCKGANATFFAVAANGGPSPSYQWQKNGANVGTNSNTYADANLNDGDAIQCILTSNLSCASTATAQSNIITMTVSTPPANLRYPAATGLAGQYIQLQARNLGGTSYNWQPATGLSNHLVINPTFNYGQSVEYKIYINTAAGCQVVDTQLVTLKGTKGLYVPKAFSPNSDGVNDRLYPILVGIQQLYYFRIYNRWGNLIFETNSGNPSSGWDGTFKGSRQPVETYTWAAEALDIDGLIIKKTGSTLLVR